jgi:hypothetical protein
LGILRDFHRTTAPQEDLQTSAEIVTREVHSGTDGIVAHFSTPPYADFCGNDMVKSGAVGSTNRWAAGANANMGYSDFRVESRSELDRVSETGVLR